MRNNSICALSTKLAFGAVLIVVTVAAHATGILEVPNVELLYMNGMPEGPVDRARANSLGPQFRKYLAQYGYTLAPTLTGPDVAARMEYLFHHSDEAAALGHRVGASWMVLSHIVEPTSLWAEFNVQLVEVATGQIRADYDVELKGPVGSNKDTDRAAERMAQKVDDFLKRFAKMQLGSN